MEIVEFFFGNFWHWLGGLFYLAVIFSVPLISFTSKHKDKMKERVKIEGVMLKCDKCGEYYESGEGPTIIPCDIMGIEVEAQALEDGWVKVGDKHFCPDCYKN